MAKRKTWKNRVVDTKNVSIADIKKNIDNLRDHPEFQKKSFQKIIDKIGYTTPLVVNVNTGNIIDGHMRHDLAKANSEEKIPVTYVDLSEEEERIAVASHDAIGSLADFNFETVQEALSNYDLSLIDESISMPDISITKSEESKNIDKIFILSVFEAKDIMGAAQLEQRARGLGAIEVYQSMEHE